MTFVEPDEKLLSRLRRSSFFASEISSHIRGGAAARKVGRFEIVVHRRVENDVVEGWRRFSFFHRGWRRRWRWSSAARTFCRERHEMNETPLTNSLSISLNTPLYFRFLSLSVSNQTRAQIERLDDGILVKKWNEVYWFF